MTTETEARIAALEAEIERTEQARVEEQLSIDPETWAAMAEDDQRDAWERHFEAWEWADEAAYDAADGRIEGLQFALALLKPERSGRTNLQRALNGRDLCESALGSGAMALEDYEAGLTDALANLMHFARRYDIDFDAHLAMAARHHSEESRLRWDEAPV